MNWLNFIAVFLGGAIGSVLRYALTLLSMTRYPQMNFPLPTFCINVLGSFLIGLLSIYFIHRIPHSAGVLRVFLMVGFLGGFTTFSSFSLETISLLQKGESVVAMTYVGVSVFLGLLAAWLGIMLGKFFYA